MRKVGPVPLVIALLLALLLAIRATTPPAPASADAAAGVFSAGRAMADVRIIAARPHPTGTAENAAVRAYLIQRMQALGLEVSTSEGVLDAASTKTRNGWSGRNDPPVTLVNLIGVLPGKNRALPAVLLMSHHDTVWGSPGAADDTAGVAASLEVVRAIRAGKAKPERDLIVMFTDAEEIGLVGARQFFASHPMRSKIGAIINLETRGGGGRTTLFETSRQNGQAIKLYADAVSRPGASSLSAYIYSVLPNDTDLTHALPGPYTAFNFAFIGRSGLYHSPLATPDNLDQGALQDMGDQTLQLAGALLKAQELPGKARDRVFFDLFGMATVHYPAGAGWAMLAFAVVGLGFAVRGTALREIGFGALRVAGLTVLAALLLFALNSVSSGSEAANYYDRLAEIPQLELMALYGAVAAVLAAFAGWRGRPGAAIGAIIPLLLLAIVTQWLAPTAAYVLVLPCLLVALGHAIAARWPGTGATITQTGVAALVTGYMLAIGHQAMQGVGPDMPGTAALPLAIAVSALAPLIPALNLRRALISAGAFALAGLAVALWVQTSPLAETVAVYSSDKSVPPIPITKPE